MHEVARASARRVGTQVDDGLVVCAWRLFGERRGTAVDGELEAHFIVGDTDVDSRALRRHDGLPGDGELAFGVEREFRLGRDEAFVRGVDRARAWGHLRNVMDVDGGVLLGGEGRGKRSGSRAGEQL
jgi:hypothetical protein